MPSRDLLQRSLASLLVPVVILLGCPPGNPPLAPVPGAPEYQTRLLQPVPGGAVHAGGGNLLLERTDLALDTRLGPLAVSAVYNSASQAWHASFELRYDGTLFLDETGAQHDTSGLAPGGAIPGSHWVVQSASSLRTKGGMLHDFDAEGRLIAVRRASAAWPALVYLGAPVAGDTRTVAIEQCTDVSLCVPVFDFGYDAAGRLVAVTDRAGRGASFGYDASGRLTTARDGLDMATGAPGFRYEYDGAGRITARVNSEGERIEYTYSAGRVSRVRAIGESDPEHSFFYEGRDGTGLYLTRYLDPMGAETRYRYDAERRLHEWIQLDTDAHRALTWSGVRPASETRPDGTTTVWTWANDDVVTRTDPSGNVVSHAYAPTAVDRARPYATPLARVEDLVGLVLEHTYDAQGRRVASTNGAGDTTSWTYAPDETVATATLPDGVAIAYAGYGDHGHAGSMTVAGDTRNWSFDAAGNVLRGGADPAPMPWGTGNSAPGPSRGPETGGVFERRYDADRNLVALDLVGVSETLPTALVTLEQEWRSDGSRLAIRRPGGGDHEFEYDALGRLREQRERADGIWHATAFEHDLAGRRTAVSLPNGMRREWSYDPAGRPAARTLRRGGSLEAITLFGYAAHRLASVTDPIRGTTEQYFYDGAGRRTLVIHPDGEQTFDTFDLRSRRRTRAFLTASLALVRQLGRTYDLADREVVLDDGSTPLVTREYTAGKVREVRTGNGLVRRFTRDPVSGALTASTTHDASGELVAETTLTRTPFGQLLAGLEIAAVTETHAGVAATTAEHYWIGPQDPGQVIPYAEAGERIVAWERGDGNTIYYDHDAVSHLTGDTAAFTNNAEGNRLLRAAGRDYAWDEAGYAVQRGAEALLWHASGRIAARGTETFEWDALDRLARWTTSGGERRWAFGGALEVDANDTPIALDLADVRIDLATGALTYRHRDFRGNVKFTSDAAGAVQSHYRYHPYGVDAVFGSTDDARRFAGGPSLGDGVTLLGARIYDADAGRFLSPDPVFQILNQTGYTFGNPVWFWDPDGAHPEPSAEARANALMDMATAFSSGVTAVTAILLAGPTAPALAVASLAAVFALSGLQFAWAAAQVLNTSFASGATNSAPRSGLTPVGGSASGGGGGAATCAPTRLARLPLHRAVVFALIVLQLLLAVAWLRRRHGGP